MGLGIFIEGEGQGGTARVETRYIPPSWVQPVASEKQNSETFALLRYATLLNSNSDNVNKLFISPSFLLLSLSGPFREPEGAGRACVNAWYIAKTLLFFRLSRRVCFLAFSSTGGQLHTLVT